MPSLAHEQRAGAHVLSRSSLTDWPPLWHVRLRYQTVQPFGVWRYLRNTDDGPPSGCTCSAVPLVAHSTLAGAAEQNNACAPCTSLIRSTHESRSLGLCDHVSTNLVQENNERLGNMQSQGANRRAPGLSLGEMRSSFIDLVQLSHSNHQRAPTPKQLQGFTCADDHAERGGRWG